VATNKHAIIRYHALDKCFSNPRKRYYIDDLVDACNDALYENTGLAEGVKKRQIFEDIKFMESTQGWSIELDRIKDGKQVFYRYSDKSYSIKKQPINESEAEQLKETLSILTRFKGIPQFEWIEEMIVHIEELFSLKTRNRAVVSFEHNPYLKGLWHFTNIFNSIQYKKVIKVEYHGYRQERPMSILYHPYYLKQYNSRWFLFGYNEEQKKISNLALDRIINLKPTRKSYIENENLDFEEYFEDVVGVTVSNKKETEKVLLEIDIDLWPYIESKPIHGSQKVVSRKSNVILIELRVQPNYELVSTLFSFGEKLRIIEPKNVKEEIINKAKSLINKYI
jgi:predicted DNA-binding transcriptional regulator YafY